MIEQLAAIQPDVLLMGRAAAYPYSEEQWTEGTARVLDRLSASIGSIFVIRGTPSLPFDGPGCLARRQWQPGAEKDVSDCSASAGSHSGRVVLAALEQAAARYPNVRVLDLNPLVCPDDVCSAERDGVVVFRDGQHVTDLYVQTVTPQVVSHL